LTRTHRISAGAIVLYQDKLLLVRYPRENGTTYLAAPGGGVEIEEGLPEAAIREVKEETGLEVNPFPYRVIFVEEFLSRNYRHIKIWLLCCLVRGELIETPEAKKEGILEVGWYNKADLADEVVYPEPLKTTDWQAFLNQTWDSQYLKIHETDF
jgi:8-oxo-dGTP diphosphatase